MGHLPPYGGKAATADARAKLGIEAAEQLVALCDEARFNPEPPGAPVRERALGLLLTALS